MNFYTFEDLEKMKSENKAVVVFSRCVTDEINSDFAKISGSYAPLHHDDKFAQDLGYAKRISYGLLSLVFAGKFEELLPGCFAIGYEWHAKFKKPIYIGDTLTFTGTLGELRKNLGTIQLLVTVKNQSEVIVANIIVKMKIGVNKQSPTPP